ncbi:MAG: hypothetical protein V3S08_01035 [Phycisphaerales bacterium]
MSHEPTFVLVGHCWADRIGLRSAVKRAVRGARIERAQDLPALRSHLGDGAVLLINRVLGGGFDTGSGVELIQLLAETGDAGSAILISNHADAQDQAVAAGAQPGFGKSQLRDQSTEAMLRQAAGV